MLQYLHQLAGDSTGDAFIFSLLLAFHELEGLSVRWNWLTSCSARLNFPVPWKNIQVDRDIMSADTLQYCTKMATEISMFPQKKIKICISVNIRI